MLVCHAGIDVADPYVRIPHSFCCVQSSGQLAVFSKAKGSGTIWKWYISSVQKGRESSDDLILVGQYDACEKRCCIGQLRGGHSKVADSLLGKSRC